MSGPAKYRKKPVVIEAMTFDGLDTYLDITAWWGSWKTETLDLKEKFEFRGGTKPIMLIQTPEGWMSASLGDKIIRGVNDELYPCKPDIFEQTYEVVSK